MILKRFFYAAVLFLCLPGIASSQTKRQYYPHFDTTQAMGYISCYIQYNGYLLKT